MKIIIREPEYAHLTRAPNGLFGRYLHGRARRVLNGAKMQVGVLTGELRGSLRIEVRTGGFLRYYIGSDNWKAYLHHEGARSHEIVPINAKVLKFPGSSGTIVNVPKVRIPAQPPNRYLTDNLDLAL